jgi:predicted GNAT family N-acyltransferase
MSRQNEYTVTVLNESDISAEIDEDIRQILIKSFAHRTKEFGKRRWLNGNVPDFTAIAHCHGKVVAHAAAIDRIITADDKSVRTCGIANVCVAENHRGKGVVDIILKAVSDEATRRRYDIGLLFCQDHVKNIYMRNGWVDMPNVSVEYIENGRHVCMGLDRHKMFCWLEISGLGKTGRIDLNGTRW